ncbi:MAG TPA: hypothetical protein VF997_19175 [Polyangia bacterium]
MPLVDLVLLMGVGAAIVGVAGWLGFRLDRRRKHRDDEELGRRNAERLQREAARRCVECDREVDPSVDVFDQEAWWCKECWLRVVR